MIELTYAHGRYAGTKFSINPKNIERVSVAHNPKVLANAYVTMNNGKYYGVKENYDEVMTLVKWRSM